MNNATIWEACELYGTDVILPDHNNPTLFKRWLDRLRSMETQLLCDTNGERVEGKNKFTDDTGQEWGPVRWPWKAKTNNPDFKDYPRKFLFDDHLLAIGSTGWDWKNKESRWVGYDFDAITGHAPGIGYKDEDLELVAKAAPSYVDVIRSTRGAGKHLYIFFDAPYPRTLNHNEHAAVARSLLPVMSAAAGFNFSTKMDVCGSILWIWHRDATVENRGFTSLKEATQQMTANDVPPNWRDHLDVVTGKHNKVRVRGWDAEGNLTEGKDIEEATQASSVIKLDDCHKRFMKDLEATGYTFYWVHDHHLAQTHTCAIKQVHKEWAVAGHPMKGPFDTTAPGSDKGKPNAFMRPRYGGGWDVYRFGEGEVSEHALWDNFNSKTHITLNVDPSLRQGALAAGGSECENVKKGGYQLEDVESLYEALTYLGSDFRLPDSIRPDDRTFNLLTRSSDSRIVVQIERKKTDVKKDFAGWEKKNATTWQKVIKDRVNTKQDEDQISSYWDKKVRAIKSVSMSQNGEVGGQFDRWLIRDNSHSWVVHPKDNVVIVVGKEAGAGVGVVLASTIDNAWTRVTKPFEPEYPGGREWNYDAPQLVYQPRAMPDGRVPHHPHWDLVFNHCGTDLDQYVVELDWCKEWEIKTGGDYLRTWLAAMLRFPYCRLPYLFMWSEAQETGKTTWHEIVKILLTTGVSKADGALTSKGDFNGELYNVILGTVDETDIAKSPRTVYNKIKDWTTALIYMVHHKNREPYDQANFLHLIQTANDRLACPVFAGDSRVTSMEVPVIREKIGKDLLFDNCRAEAPDFMATLMNIKLPRTSERMRVPVIETSSKSAAMSDNRSALEVFIEENCTYSPGGGMKYNDFAQAFIAQLEVFERADWPKSVIRQSLPACYPVGIWNYNILTIGNIVLGTDVAPADVGSPKFVKSGKRLAREE